jgi:dGTPase
LIDRNELPAESVKRLGDTNGTIVYNLVTDIIHNSLDNDCIAFSPAVSGALKELKAFNYQRIYKNPMIKKNLSAIKRLYEVLFERFVADIRHQRTASAIYENFIDGMAEQYMATHQPEEIARDFISGMTDKYFLKQAPPELHPHSPMD